MSESKHVVVVFDLDETITVLDTYPAFLLTLLKRRPTRWLPALLLPEALVLQRLGFFDNTWLKKTAFRMILSGLTRPVVEDAVDTFVQTLMKKLRPAAKWVIDEHRTLGHQVLLATASFDLWVRPLASKLGIVDVLCTEAEWHDDTLTSQDRLSNCHGKEKARRVAQFIDSNYPNAQVIAYTDSQADLPLLALATVPVAVNPTKKLQSFANGQDYLVQNWQDTTITQQSFAEVQDALARHGSRPKLD